MGEEKHILDELAWRGFITGEQAFSVGADDLLKTRDVTLYAGFDPSAPSLHVGHLIPFMALLHFARYGHHPIALMGGGTGLVGDPSGKDKERPLLTPEEINFNVEQIKVQMQVILERLLDNPEMTILNNYDWLGDLNFIKFARDIGKHFTINDINRKESIQKRLNSGYGLSFTEYTYIFLQSYDFLHLFKEKECTMQIGGSDQWGNITAGIDLIRKKVQGSAHGLVFPLLTKADGSKFGKSEKGALFLDPAMTKPFTLYQYWIKADDKEVMSFIKMLTFANRKTVTDLEKRLETEPEKRDAHRYLAEEITRFVHGEKVLAQVQQAVKILFGKKFKDVTPEEMEAVYSVLPSSPISKEQLKKGGIPFTDLIESTGFVGEKYSNAKFIKEKGFRMNGRKVNDVSGIATEDDLFGGRFLLLRKGKRDYFLLIAE